MVIPTLNSPWINQTLDALRKQSYDLDKVEVIVVGRDDEGRITSDNFVQFIETEGPKPPAFSRNRGLFAARGDIVCFTDDDCLPHPHWLAKLADAYSDPEVKVVGGGVQFPAKGYWARCDALASVYEYLDFRKPGLRRQLPSMNLSVRRKALSKLGGFDENYPFASGEDAELSMRLRRAGYQLYFTPDALVYHLGWRKTFGAAWRHIYQYGRFSPWITPAVADIVKPPFFLRHWLWLLLAMQGL